MWRYEDTNCENKFVFQVSVRWELVGLCSQIWNICSDSSKWGRYVINIFVALLAQIKTISHNLILNLKEIRLRM